MLIGTNPDRRLPHGDYFRIGNGAMVHMLEYCSEQKAWMIGKPHEPMLKEALRYAQIAKEDAVVIGDNLETDVAFGLRLYDDFCDKRCAFPFGLRTALSASGSDYR